MIQPPSRMVGRLFIDRGLFLCYIDIAKEGDPMKYCDRCGARNEKHQLFCQGCGKPLQKNARQSSQKMAEQETALQMEKERKRKIRGYCLLTCMYLLHVALGVALIISGKAREADISALPILIMMLFFPGAGYLSLYKPELMFKIQHFFSLRDVEQAEPSDWYMASTQLGGVLLWAMGLGLLAAPWIF